MTDRSSRHGGRILVDQLAIQGVERVFCLPGESFLAALDGLHGAPIETVVTRNEGGAAIMAEADGKLTGRPGIAFVTRGPGAANAASGVHIAFQDSTPMILFIGQVGRGDRDREAFQEVDFRAMFAPLAKWAAEIDDTARIPEYLSRAFHVARTGRPGPVVLSLPEDMLSAEAEAADVPPASLPSGLAAEADIAAVSDRLAAAEWPMIVVGGGGWSQAAATALGRLADRARVPVAASFRCQDYLDNDHPAYAGDLGVGPNPALADRVKQADTLLVLGARLGEVTTSGYTLVAPPVPRQSLIHVYPDPDELGRVFRPDLPVVATAARAVEQLAEHAAAPAVDRENWLAAARADYEAWQVPQQTPGALRMERVVAHLGEVLPADAILTSGAGNYSAWLHRYHRYHGWRTQLAPTSGSMGYGLPAAIAAKLRHPDREVVCLSGDGDFQMIGQEFGTAAAQGAAIVVLISNNGLYGTIRMHQERTYPGRPSGTALANPDFARLAQAYDAFGEVVETDAQFPGALARARRAGTPAILDLRVAPEALSPTRRLDPGTAAGDPPGKGAR